MRMYILINVLYIYKIISILIISSDIVFRGRIFFRMIRCYFSCEDIPDKITKEGGKKEAFQREEQRWISRFERKINFRHSRRIIDYPILAANLFDLFSTGKKSWNTTYVAGTFIFFFFPFRKIPRNEYVFQEESRVNDVFDEKKKK